MRGGFCFYFAFLKLRADKLCKNAGRWIQDSHTPSVWVLSVFSGIVLQYLIYIILNVFNFNLFNLFCCVSHYCETGLTTFVKHLLLQFVCVSSAIGANCTNSCTYSANLSIRCDCYCPLALFFCIIISLSIVYPLMGQIPWQLQHGSWLAWATLIDWSQLEGQTSMRGTNKHLAFFFTKANTHSPTFWKIYYRCFQRVWIIVTLSCHKRITVA